MKSSPPPPLLSPLAAPPGDRHWTDWLSSHPTTRPAAASDTLRWFGDGDLFCLLNRFAGRFCPIAMRSRHTNKHPHTCMTRLCMARTRVSNSSCRSEAESFGFQAVPVHESEIVAHQPHSTTHSVLGVRVVDLGLGGLHYFCSDCVLRS